MSDINILTVGPDESDNAQFGEFLFDLRRAAKLSRIKAGQLIGVSSEYVRVIELGKRTPALGTALKILDIYQTPFTLNGSRIILEGFSVEFTSRIKEARYSLPKLSQSREELIVQIIESLLVADHDTVRKIHSKLVRSA